jgi:probable HAF family extracellular repeat protein
MRTTSKATRLLVACTMTAAAGTVLAMAPASPALGAPVSPLRTVDLGTLPGALTSTAYGINERGDVVGESDGHAVLWRDRRIIDLGAGTARGVNEHGVVVGSADVGGTTHAMLWRQGRAVDLGTLPGATTSCALAVNDRGDVAGYGDSASGALRAIVWRAGTAVDLGPAGAYASSARDVNARGDVVGEIFLPPQEMKDLATVWRHGTASVLTQDSAVASGINDQGDITGFFFTTPGSFLWRRGVLTRITPPTGMLWLQAQAVNDRAQVVGYGDSGGFRWQDGRLTLLPGLRGLPGSGGSAAYDINDRGQIVGGASSTGDGLTTHAVLWLPGRG